MPIFMIYSFKIMVSLWFKQGHKYWICFWCLLWLSKVIVTGIQQCMTSCPLCLAQHSSIAWQQSAYKDLLWIPQTQSQIVFPSTMCSPLHNVFLPPPCAFPFHSKWEKHIVEGGAHVLSPSIHNLTTYTHTI